MNGMFDPDNLWHMTPDEQAHYVSAGLVRHTNPVIGELLHTAQVKLETVEDESQIRQDTIVQVSKLLRDGVDGDNVESAVKEARNLLGHY